MAKALTISTNYGVEQDELVVPVEELTARGVAVTVAAAAKEPIQTLVGDKDPGKVVDSDASFDEVDPSEFDVLIIPGGTLNADSLRLDDTALSIIKNFTDSGRPVAAICHGPWAVLEAGGVEGKSLTSYASLQTDIANAGGSWTDQPVVIDNTGGYTLITSRNPDDLKDFVGAIGQALDLS
ncbi:DJ-1/PfpI/YhbO family deglycase/protease [Microlunatus sp. Gsoil 973]|uniref:DJ-1/PfpI/YhbO family deglycase/protease n=1 Tax=Microlunatus sp. Gsoil 973 TaxID=2672569 RepID=UPI0012B44158|nr:DJ-1/PfpI/YhbO family deglycase/protease [Microlunatus sp. Gsoil 973]QGN33065.1 DJ-1/PfpI/YhbO family deglycase/protease [Microlunatus sp. Gsoil 973]